MARSERPGDLDRVTGQAKLVEVTVIGEPNVRGGSQRLGRAGPIQAGVGALLVAALLAIVITTVAGGRHRGTPARPTPARLSRVKPAPVNSTPAEPSVAEPTPPEPAATQRVRGRPAAARLPGPAGVAAAYGYPLRCLSVTIASGNRSYARADYNRVSACGRYDGTVTAVFHRVNGEWRPVLDATGYSCPIASMTRAVAAELDVCP
jgi:hypothetical protein